MSDLIGKFLGQYEILALLGEGGMAGVYRARQASIKRDVAIKVIRPEMKNVEDFLKRFQREAETVASMSHPHINKVFDYGTHEGKIYLVMELMTGGSLADRIRQGPLPLEDVDRILEEIASALDYAHLKGIIHRDLKPHNILFDETGGAFLGDFGLAKTLTTDSTLTQSGMAIGTPAYMSPEQWQGQVLDARSDIYSLGIVLFEMLSGQMPFQAETPPAMMYAHLQERPPLVRDLREGLPSAVEDVIQKALAKKREDRFATATEMAQAFHASLQGTRLPTVKVARTGRFGRETGADAGRAGTGTPPLPQRRPRTVLLGLGALLVVLVIGGLIGFSSGLFGGATGTPTRRAALQSSDTLAASPTPSHTPTSAPGAETIVAIILTQYVTLTANAVASFTKTPTPDLEQTGTAIANATGTAIAVASFTQTPTPTPFVIVITNTPLPTATRTPTPAVTATPTRAPDIVLVYDDAQLNLINVSPRTLNIANLLFIQRSSPLRTFEATEWTAGSPQYSPYGLAASWCFQVSRIEERNIAPLPQCQPRSGFRQVAFDKQFWVPAVPNATAFEVVLGGRAIATCPFAARRCEFALS